MDPLERRVAELEARVAKLTMPAERKRREPVARKGRSAIEYGLIAALIAVAAIAAMQGLGNQLKTTFSNVSSNMKAS